MDYNNPGSGVYEGGIFGGESATYSGVPLAELNPIAPYLNIDPRYLIQVTDDFISLAGANQSHGHLALFSFTIGGSYMAGAAFGSLSGLRQGLKETRHMTWRKPRNVQIVNMIRQQGASWGNALGSIALLYSLFNVAIEKSRGAEDAINPVAAGTLTGMMFKSTGGLKSAARGGVIGLAMSGLYMCVCLLPIIN